jgi:hypothetical protein
MSALPKLLYILPDLAYVAELLPTKKSFTYAIHNFRQINGEFLDDNEFIEANIAKLLDRLDVEEYIVVLPDYLFTDTIVNVRAGSESKVREYLKEQLLPGLEITTTTHQIETFILTEFKGSYKVQLSALERSLLTPLSRAMVQRGLSAHSIVSLSWSAKSIISLEPSVSVLQMGEKLYVAQHYIGIDQTSFTPVLESTNVVDAIKTLKGAEPSIQTVYVLANEVFASDLKEALRDLVPVQQLALFNETEAKMPSYVKQIIESSMRTLNAPDYMVPKFALEKVSPAQVHVDNAASQMTTTEVESIASDTTLAATKAGIESATQIAAAAEMTAAKSTLPKPGEMQTELVEEIQSTPEIDLQVEEIGEPSHQVKQPIASGIETEPVELDDASAAQELEKLFGVDEESQADSKTTASEAQRGDTPQSIESMTTEQTEKTVSTIKYTSDDTTKMDKKSASINSQPKQVIKNQTDEKNMVKLIFVGLASFFVTIGLGIGLGLGIMMVSNQKPSSQTTVIEPAVPSITPSASASATPTASISAAKTATKSATTTQTTKVLVVNATKVAGYAGKVATKLQAAGYTGVKTANAAGTYEPGMYVLQHQKSETEVASLAKASGLQLKTASGIELEDPKKLYDAVVVLAE